MWLQKHAVMRLYVRTAWVHTHQTSSTTTSLSVTEQLASTLLNASTGQDAADMRTQADTYLSGGRAPVKIGCTVQQAACLRHILTDRLLASASDRESAERELESSLMEELAMCGGAASTLDLKQAYGSSRYVRASHPR